MDRGPSGRRREWGRSKRASSFLEKAGSLDLSPVGCGIWTWMPVSGRVVYSRNFVSNACAMELSRRTGRDRAASGSSQDLSTSIIGCRPTVILLLYSVLSATDRVERGMRSRCHPPITRRRGWTLCPEQAEHWPTVTPRLRPCDQLLAGG